MKKWWIAVSLFLLLCGTNAFSQSVKVNWNSKAPFSQYKTYSWRAASNPGNPIFAQWVQPDVDAELGAKGIQFLYPGQSPDLYVIYSVHMVESEGDTTMEGYGWAEGPWEGDGILNDEPSNVGSPDGDTVRTGRPSSLGILRIDIVDARKKVVVWRAQGTIEHVSKSDKKNSRQVQNIVTQMFQKFPPN